MDSYVRSTSDTWALKLVKISRPPKGRERSATKSHRWRRFSRRDTAKPITVQLTYHGGGSGWVRVAGRGEVNWYPADTWLLNLVLDINNAH